MKKKLFWCRKCLDRTLHSYVGTQSDYEGSGIVRVFMAVFTLGATETTLADRLYQCDVCGHVVKR